MTQTASEQSLLPSNPPHVPAGPGRFARLWDTAGMALVYGLLFVIASLCVPNFCSPINLQGLALAVSTVGIIACTMLFCLAAGDFDLSIGSVVAFSGVLAVLAANKTHSISLGVAAGVLAGGVVGLINGVVIARLGINALITTLATMQMVRGLGLIVTDGRAVGVEVGGFAQLGISGTPAFHVGPLQVVSIPTPVWIMLGCFAIYGLLLNKTTFGRNTLAIGGNAEAARLAGIQVARTKITIFTLQGLMAGFAGVILASRMTSGQPNTAQGLELQVISACVLGGVSLTGGVGSMLSVVVGVLIMGTVQNAMNLRNVPTFYQYVASGAILLAAVLIDSLKQRHGR